MVDKVGTVSQLEFGFTLSLDSMEVSESSHYPWMLGISAS